MLLRNVNNVRVGHECGSAFDLTPDQSAAFMSGVMSVAQGYRPTLDFDCPSCSALLQVDVQRAKRFLALWTI
jgi:hypothetical protein